MKKEKFYCVTIIDRMNVVNPHYQVDGGLTKQDVMERYMPGNTDKEDFNSAISCGYLGKDGVYEYLIKEVK